MSAVPRTLAKRLDRLSRGGHRFHRFAHHPLCSQYRSELLQIGRKGRLCRGCTLALAGAALGAALGACVRFDGVPAIREPFLIVAVCAALVFSGGSLALGWPYLKPGPMSKRRSKFVTRFLPLLLLSSTFTSGVRLADGVGFLSALLAAGTCTIGLTVYRRRGPDRRPCAVCPERSTRGVCSGYAPIVLRERAFARVVRRMLERELAQRQ